MTASTIGIGVCGLGRAFILSTPALAGDPRVRLVAAAEPWADARDRFRTEFGGPAYENIDSLCANRDVDLIYVASPHALHARHVLAALRAGKHVLVEKPMALSLAECDSMIAAADQAGVQLLVGPSHGFDAPIALAARMIGRGDFGAPRMIVAMNYTDFIYRPRHAEELDPAKGGGVLMNQSPHQIDVVRRLAGSRVRSVRATAGVWDVTRPVDGAYSAHLAFDNQVAASLTYSGYGHFDSDAFQDWVGETGLRKDPEEYARARRVLAPSPEGELSQRRARAYGDAAGWPAHETERSHEHFGFVLASCERADIRPMTGGVIVYGDRERQFHALPAPRSARAELIEEIYGALVEGKAPLFSGQWGRDTLEVCLAMGASSRERREIALHGRTDGREGTPT